MHYFITSRIDSLTSAIELAEIKRLKLFKKLNIPAKIVTLDYFRYQCKIWKELGISNDVVNPIEYFQKLDTSQNSTHDVLKKVLSDKKLTIR